MYLARGLHAGSVHEGGREGGEGRAAVSPARVLTQYCSGRSEVPGQWCRLRTQIIDTEDLNISVSRQLTPLP